MPDRVLPEKLLAVAQILAATGEYAPLPDGSTQCNRYVAAFARALFAYDAFDGLLANQIVDRLRQGTDGWTKLFDGGPPEAMGAAFARARDLANAGRFVIAALKHAGHGHVAAVLNGDLLHSDTWLHAGLPAEVPSVAQAGEAVFPPPVHSLAWAFSPQRVSEGEFVVYARLPAQDPALLVASAALVENANHLLPGLDVSHWQGDVDWVPIAGAGTAFAVTKATDGGGKVDPKFAANWSAIRAAGLVRGAYHYYRTSADPEAQADNYCDVVGKLGAMDLPPILDLEEPAQWAAIPDPAARADLVARFIEVARSRLGRTPILYVGVSFWNDVFAGTDRFKSNPLWIANYTTALQPRLPGGWTDWAFWQYSNKGNSPGVQGDVDLDFFNGSIAELLDLAAVANA